MIQQMQFSVHPVERGGQNATIMAVAWIYGGHLSDLDMKEYGYHPSKDGLWYADIIYHGPPVYDLAGIVAVMPPIKEIGNLYGLDTYIFGKGVALATLRPLVRAVAEEQDWPTTIPSNRLLREVLKGVTG
jgi:hypothetical protein